MSAAVPAFSIAVPGDWFTLILEDARDAEHVGSMVDGRVEQGDLDDDVREEAIALITRITQRATADGVRFAAALVAADDQGGIVVSTTLSVGRLEPEPPANSNDSDVHDDLGVTIGSPAPATTATAGAGSSGATLANTVTTQVALPAGPAVRLERVFEYPVDEARSHEVYAVQYVLPVDGDGLAFTLTGVSPAIRRKADLDRVFAEIADTIQIER